MGCSIAHIIIIVGGSQPQVVNAVRLADMRVISTKGQLKCVLSPLQVSEHNIKLSEILAWQKPASHSLYWFTFTEWHLLQTAHFNPGISWTLFYFRTQKKAGPKAECEGQKNQEYHALQYPHPATNPPTIPTLMKLELQYIPTTQSSLQVHLVLMGVLCQCLPNVLQGTQKSWVPRSLSGWQI